MTSNIAARAKLGAPTVVVSLHLMSVFIVDVSTVSWCVID